MKNPLVDALRQATEEDACGSGPEQEPSQNVDKLLPIADSVPAAEPILDLVDSVVLPAPLSPTESNQDYSIEGEEVAPLEEMRIAPDADRDRSANDETLILPKLNMQNIVHDVVRGDAPAIMPVPRTVARKQRSQHWISRVGRWSPIITMLALSGVAGAYALYQFLTVTNLNHDLSEMTLRAGTDSATDAATNDWSDLPENNVFAESPGYVRLQPVSPAVATSAAAVGIDKPRSTVTRPAVRPGLRQEVRPVSDPAFGDIRAGFDAYQAGDYARAEASYRRAIVLDANHRQGLAGLAAVLQMTATPAEWIPVYEKLLEVDPHNTVAASILLAQEVTGDAQQKQTGLRVLLQKNPDLAELHLARGLLAGESGHWADARLAFLEAHRTAPENSNYSFNAAVSMEHLGRYEEARLYYQLALDTTGNHSLINPEFIATQIRKMTTYSGIPQ